MSAASDRQLLCMVIDCACRINHDGKSITVISDAEAILDWIETCALARAVRDPIRNPSTAPPTPGFDTISSEVADLLSRTSGGARRTTP